MEVGRNGGEDVTVGLDNVGPPLQRFFSRQQNDVTAVSAPNSLTSFTNAPSPHCHVCPASYTIIKQQHQIKNPYDAGLYTATSLIL